MIPQELNDPTILTTDQFFGDIPNQSESANIHFEKKLTHEQIIKKAKKLINIDMFKAPPEVDPDDEVAVKNQFSSIKESIGNILREHDFEIIQISVRTIGIGYQRKTNASAEVIYQNKKTTVFFEPHRVIKLPPKEW